MKNNKTLSENYGLDLKVLILMISLMGANFVHAQENELQKGITIFEQKNYYGAKRFFTDYLRNHPDNAHANYYLGRIAMEEQELKQATDFFDKATAADDKNSEYYTWKGIAYVQLLSTVDFMTQGLYAPKALNALETAVDLNPNSVEARMWLAGYYSQAPVFAGGSEDKAREQYDAIMKIDPAYEPVYLNYGIALLGFEEYDEAKENFEKALEVNEKNYMACLFIGRLSAESGKYNTQGELALKKFIDLAPESYKDSLDEAWWYLGTIYLQQDQNEEARTAFEKAVALDPAKEEYQKSLKKIM